MKRAGCATQASKLIDNILLSESRLFYKAGHLSLRVEF